MQSSIDELPMCVQADNRIDEEQAARKEQEERFVGEYKALTGAAEVSVYGAAGDSWWLDEVQVLAAQLEESNSMLSAAHEQLLYEHKDTKEAIAMQVQLTSKPPLHILSVLPLLLPLYVLCVLPLYVLCVLPLYVLRVLPLLLHGVPLWSRGVLTLLQVEVVSEKSESRALHFKQEVNDLKTSLWETMRIESQCNEVCKTHFSQTAISCL